VIVKLTVQVRLLPTPLQAAALEATLHACNEAATWAGEVAFEKGVKRNFALREHVYGEIRARWGLGAQAAQHVIKKTCDAYATLKAGMRAGNLGRPGSKRYRKANEKPIVFRPEGAQPYDDRMLSWRMAERRISIWTVAGRIKDVAFTAAPEQLATVELNRKGESDLVCREGMWFLLATPADGRLHRDVQDHQPVVGRLPGGRGAHQHGYRRLERLVSRLVLRGRTEAHPGVERRRHPVGHGGHGEEPDLERERDGGFVGELRLHRKLDGGEHEADVLQAGRSDLRGELTAPPLPLRGAYPWARAPRDVHEGPIRRHSPRPS
jgi:hypothetical protein